MSILSGLRRVTRRTTAILAATVTAAAVAFSGAGAASADDGATPNRTWLRPGCQYDAAMYWVQRCDVWSPAMNRAIPVQILPAKHGGNGGLYLLDGLRANEVSSGWIQYGTNPQALFFNDNINLVMPVGGEASFYADWQGNNAKLNPFTPVTYKWETFLTEELPAYLEGNFGVARDRNSVAGLSMGAVGALNLAARHPGQFRQVLSYSGYPTLTLPGGYAALAGALIAGGNYNVHALYGSFLSPSRYQQDPFLNIKALRNTDVYVSAATGIPFGPELTIKPKDVAVGSALEFVAQRSTQLWAAKAHLQGLNFTENYPPTGIHNWWLWGDQLAQTRERILAAIQ